MKDLTIIVPLIDFETEMNEMFDDAFNSIINADKNSDTSIIFIGPSTSLNIVKEYEWGDRNVLFLENDKNVSLQFQINKAVKDVKTTYFSILEFDDRYTSFWFDEVENQLKYTPEVSLFLPLVEVFDFQNKQNGSIGYANEPVWASSFSEEIGYIDIDCLKNHYNFMVSGGIFKKSDFLAVGGLKNTLSVFFWYEFLLRLCNNSKKVYVIPKVGYEHAINRDKSLTSIYQGLSQDELDFWFTTAQEEYPYKTDRKKIYNPENN